MSTKLLTQEKKINDISDSFTYNLINDDPLLNPENEYSILKEKFIEVYNLEQRI
jgi:hypothetical protein